MFKLKISLKKAVDVFISLSLGIWIGWHLHQSNTTGNQEAVKYAISGFNRVDPHVAVWSSKAGNRVQNIDVNTFEPFSYERKVVSSCPHSNRELIILHGEEEFKQFAPRLLFMTAVYTFDQFLYLQKVLDAMRDHCNSGWNVTVHLQVANGLNYTHPRYVEIQDRAYCHATGQNIQIILDTYGKIGCGLNSKHRQYIKNHLEDYDYFSFAEEDMLLTVSHFRAWLSGEALLKRALPNTWLRYWIGFFRWEDSIVDSERVSWEYFPERMHVVSFNLYVFIP